MDGAAGALRPGPAERPRSLFRAADWRTALRCAAGAIGIPVLVLIPPFIVNRGAAIENVIRFPLGHGIVKSPAASPFPGHLIADNVPGGGTIATALLVLAAFDDCWLAGVAAAHRRRRGGRDRRVEPGCRDRSDSLDALRLPVVSGGVRVLGSGPATADRDGGDGPTPTAAGVVAADPAAS